MALQSWYVTTRDMPGHHDGVVKYHDCHKCWAPEAWVVSPTGSPASAGVLIPPLRTARLMCVPEATSGGAESSRHREWWWSGGGGVPGELPASQHARGPPGGCSTQHTARSAQHTQHAQHERAPYSSGRRMRVGWTGLSRRVHEEAPFRAQAVVPCFWLCGTQQPVRACLGTQGGPVNVPLIDAARVRVYVGVLSPSCLALCLLIVTPPAAPICSSPGAPACRCYDISARVCRDAVADARGLT